MGPVLDELPGFTRDVLAMLPHPVEDVPATNAQATAGRVSGPAGRDGAGDRLVRPAAPRLSLAMRSRFTGYADASNARHRPPRHHASLPRRPGFTVRGQALLQTSYDGHAHLVQRGISLLFAEAARLGFAARGALAHARDRGPPRIVAPHDPRRGAHHPVRPQGEALTQAPRGRARLSMR